ncbi:MAG: N-methyl-D-aspartate receptor NMDAR2C subunit [Candidatus Pacebacteria bacterium]|nr:N-methyl-D-aspartate receptor NMDAR2C subunit [Candidatus Paceibacterota bacterium]
MNGRNFLQNRWFGLFDRTPASEAAYQRVVGRYKANRLAYHNLAHLYFCFTALEQYSYMADDHTVVQAAIWYHDVIYDPKRSDNEAQSAAMAAEDLPHLRIQGEPIDAQVVQGLILATKHTSAPEGKNARLLVDIDLAILGTDDRKYQRYARAIRSEYSWVSEDDYRKGRAKVLQSFLDRTFIFSTEPFQAQYEARARCNLQNEIMELLGSPRSM